MGPEDGVVIVGAKCFCNVLNVLEERVASVSFWTKPGDNDDSLAVYDAHPLHLFAFFGVILLVDAQLVQPEEGWRFYRKLQLPEDLFDGGADAVQLPINGQERVGLIASPCVRDGSIWRAAGSRGCDEFALNDGPSSVEKLSWRSRCKLDKPYEVETCWKRLIIEATKKERFSFHLGLG